MKNVLFASTALVAFAGAASAEVTLSGNAEMGIFNNDSIGANTAATAVETTNGETSFFTDLDVTFTMSGETDGGLTFGASIDLDEGGDGSNFEKPGLQGGETIFLSGAFGTLTAGDTDGALDWALTEVAFNSGSLGDDETVHAGFNGNNGLDGLYDGQIVRYDYSFGDFGVALSAELAEDAGNTGDDDVFGIGFKYQLDLGGSEIGLGLGYQTAAVNNVDVDTWGLSVNGSFGGGFQAGLSYVSYDNQIPNAIADGAFTGALDDTNLFGGPNTAQGGRIVTPGADVEHVGVGVGYSAGAISASLNYGQYDLDNNGVFEGKIDGYGLTVGYDLGGGAAVQFGYGRSDYSDLGLANVDTVDTVSFGVRMNF